MEADVPRLIPFFISKLLENRNSFDNIISIFAKAVLGKVFFRGQAHLLRFYSCNGNWVTKGVWHQELDRVKFAFPLDVYYVYDGANVSG